MLITDLGKLGEYAELLNDEVGEYVISLCALYNRLECMSVEFRAALDAEALGYLEWFKDNYEITEVSVNPNPYIKKILMEK